MRNESYLVSHGKNVADYVTTDNIFDALRERDNYRAQGFADVHIVQTFDGYSSFII